MHHKCNIFITDMKKFLLTSLALTGWSFGLLPSLTYSSDLGLQYGAFGDVYYYGDGSTYPDPVHKISWEGSYFTHSHRMRLYLAYDSKYLIPNMRVNASVTYVTDPLYTFWGFNGPASMQNYDIWSNRDMTRTIPASATDLTPTNINYYGMSRDMLRILANVQGQIVPHLNWAAGINFWNWKVGSMRDNGVKDGDEKRYYNTNATLFERYKTLGLIHEDEAKGGNALEINAGVVFDTRDMEAAPNKGIWAEAYLNGNVLQHQYLKACMYFRHYIDIPIHIPAGDPVFAYRLAWQQTLAGETPLYMIQNVPLLVQRNMISEGFAWANTELRIKLVKFKLFNQYFYVAVNPFFDAGIITKPYRAAEIQAAMEKELTAKEGKLYDPTLATLPGVKIDENTNLIYDSSKVKDVIMSAGAGLKIAMNQNFIVSAEFAKCLYKPLDAGLWIGIGINYQF